MYIDNSYIKIILGQTLFFFFFNFEAIFSFVLSAIQYHLSPSKIIDIFDLVLKGPLLRL